MKITYIFRAPSKERSIERVFAPIISQMKLQGHSTYSSFAWDLRLWLISMVANVIRFAIKSYVGGLYHITGDVQYVACLINPTKTVLTIHDCVMLHNESAPLWLRRMIRKFWYEIPLKRLKYITCISETTREDIISFFPWVADKLIVIPNPVGEEFRYCPKEINKECPQILHVGTRSNKNLERVIEALDGIHCRLHIIGKLTEEQVHLLEKHHIHYKNSYHISDAAVVTAYQYADIISFPSLFEGFGMPIIEGQATGRPVLTSDREPMRTVAGKGACLVDPESVESIRHGFEALINDKNYYCAVNQAGVENAGIYDIKHVSAEYQSVYELIQRK